MCDVLYLFAFFSDVWGMTACEKRYPDEWQVAIGIAMGASESEIDTVCVCVLE